MSHISKRAPAVKKRPKKPRPAPVQKNVVSDGQNEKAQEEITGKRHYVLFVYLGFETIEKNRCDGGGVDKISTITTSTGSITAAGMQGRGGGKDQRRLEEMECRRTGLEGILLRIRRFRPQS